jgi:predicted ATPase/DNA-binding CsgD family transcriptional regulator
MPARVSRQSAVSRPGLVELPAVHAEVVRAPGLPIQRSALIGRVRELAEVERLLLRDDVGLVTLTGPGGGGKTRLALAAATGIVDQFADGASFVALAPIADADLVVNAICETLGVRESGGRPLIVRLTEYLRDREHLLVLDNFEQVLSAAPRVVELLAACPRLKVLVTSRALLHVSGEYDLPVPPLSVPERGSLPSPEALGQFEAVQLFVERAGAAHPGLALTDENASAVAEICRRLDGLPLAIELAAARSRLLPPSAMLTRLDRRLSLLTGGPSDRPSHQQTLRGTIVWSYDLLSPADQALFRRLAVFVGGCSLDSIERVARDEGRGTRRDVDVLAPHPSPLATLDGVTSLVEQSLLQRADVGDEPRLTMLETIREYALEQLEASGEAAVVRRRHAEYFLELAQEAEPRLLGPEQGAWLARLDRELDNVRAVLVWSQAAEPTDVEAEAPALSAAELGLRLGGALAWFWYIRCHLAEGRRLLEPLLAESGEMPIDVRARGLLTLGRLLQAQSDIAGASALFDEAIALCWQMDDPWWIAFAIGARGQNAMAEADYARAEALSEESLALFKSQGDPWGIGWSMGNLGRVAQAQGQHQRALALLEESLAFKRQAGDPYALGLALAFQGRAALAHGDLMRATELLEESVIQCREVGYPRGVGAATFYLGGVAWAQGRHQEAARLYAASLQIQRGEAFRSGIAQCLEGLASVCAQRAMAVSRSALARGEELGVAARLFGAAAALRQAIGVPVPPVDRPAHDAALGTVRRELGPELGPAWAVGWAAPLEESIEEALASVHPATPMAAPAGEPGRPGLAHSPVRLTRRERDVAVLVARGYSNPRISADLAISRRTVEAHITAILNKLGLSSRTQLAVWAVEHRL